RPIGQTMKTLSPAIATVVAFATRPAAAQPRPPDPNAGTCPCVTCYCDTDWNRDCIVNQTDIAVFIGDWFAAAITGQTTTDWDASGGPSGADVAIFISTWRNDLTYCGQGDQDL